MPGFVIHLSVAKEYMKKHKLEISNEEEFIEGVVAPDFVKEKSQSHYGPMSSQVSLRKYLEANEIKTDFDKGYFLHLVTDFIFYNKVMSEISSDIYNDYDILNNYLINKYNIEIPEKIKQYTGFKDGTTKILSKEDADKTIKLASNVNLEKIKEDILKTDYCQEWEEIRLLKRI